MNKLGKIPYALYTLYLFTKSDLPTSIVANTVFAVAGTLAAPVMIRDISALSCLDIIRGVLVSLYFTWHLTLCFNLGNQRQRRSIVEDGINKPWRPIPAGRISPEATLACQLVSVLSLLALCATTLGASKEAIFYLFCTWLYNERGWGDKSWWQRTLMNACGITTNLAAGLRVAAAAAASAPDVQEPGMIRFTDRTLGWLVICAAVIFTTIQVQDLRDQEGDARIRRRTVPLVLGDAPTRWLTAVAVWIWSAASPLYWGLGYAGCLVAISFGGVVAAHLLVYCDRISDDRSFKLVGTWWMSLYFLPVLALHGL